MNYFCHVSFRENKSNHQRTLIYTNKVKENEFKFVFIRGLKEKHFQPLPVFTFWHSYKLCREIRKRARQPTPLADPTFYLFPLMIWMTGQDFWEDIPRPWPRTWIDWLKKVWFSIGPTVRPNHAILLVPRYWREYAHRALEFIITDKLCGPAPSWRVASHCQAISNKRVITF